MSGNLKTLTEVVTHPAFIQFKEDFELFHDYFVIGLMKCKDFIVPFAIISNLPQKDTKFDIVKKRRDSNEWEYDNANTELSRLPIYIGELFLPIGLSECLKLDDTMNNVLLPKGF